MISPGLYCGAAIIQFCKLLLSRKSDIYEVRGRGQCSLGQEISEQPRVSVSWVTKALYTGAVEHIICIFHTLRAVICIVFPSEKHSSDKQMVSR